MINTKSMICTVEYRKHIMYTFNAFCKVVICYAVLQHGMKGTGDGKKKYPWNILQKKSFIH